MHITNLTSAFGDLPDAPRFDAPAARGLHSFTSPLNLRDVYGIGGARGGCVARVKGVLGGVRGV